MLSKQTYKLTATFFALLLAVKSPAQSYQHSASATSPAQAKLLSPATERRINDLLRRMTLEEKLGQLMQYNDLGYTAPTASAGDANVAANPQANYKLDAMQMASTGRMGSMLNVVGKDKTNQFQHAAVEKSRLHIPLLFGADIIHGFRTIYPVPLGLGATFDPDVVERLSAMSAEEATTAGVRWFYSPMVDIARDARWGRCTEGAGEDPYLGAAMARAYIDGYQGDDLSDPHQVAASVKHFAAYGAAEAGREYFTTDMSISRLYQIYLPPYKAAVEEGAATMMSAFNSLNGVPATANPFLLQHVLRDQWHFDGFVVSDYTAVMELMHHGIALTGAEAAQKAITAGTDVDMMSHLYDAELPQLVRSGKVPMHVIDDAVRRVLRVKFALGVFDHPYPEDPEVTSAVDAHRPLVREAAQKSFVLLKNDEVTNGNALLPLTPATKKIALIGPLADDSGEMVGAWSGAKKENDVITLRQALTKRVQHIGGTLLYTRGTDIVSDSTAGFADAVKAARLSDVVIMALGESSGMSGEAGSRAHLDLPGNQQQLLQEVVATGKPVILVVFSGRPLVLTWAAQHVPSILEAWFPGTEAGNALMDVMYGDVAPSGKVPMSFPYTVGQEPLYYAQFPTGRPAGNTDLSKPPLGDTRFISRYIDAPNQALFPFGFGLSYTTFAYSDVTVSRPTVPLSEARLSHKPLITVSAVVRNTGKRLGTEVVQCYVRNSGASLEQPVRELKGFTRVTLEPGESRTVTFDLGNEELSFYNNDGQKTIESTDYTTWVGGSSLATEKADFRIVSH